MKFWIDILDANGDKQGDGPIQSATNWRTVTRLDRVGNCAFTMPASDERADLVQVKREAHCYTVVGGSLTSVGAMVIDKITRDVGPSGEVVLRVEGDDILRRLVNRSVGFLEVESSSPGGSGVAIGTALTSILGAMSPSWTYTVSGTSTASVYARFAGESIFAALKRVADRFGHHFILDATNDLTWYAGPDNLPSSGVRAIAHSTVKDNENPEICLIDSLSEIEDSYDLVTRIYGFGAGDGKGRLDLTNTSRTAPTGYTLTAADSMLKNDAAETTYGRNEKYLSWKDISPLSNSDTHEETAANMLFDQMLYHLERHKDPAKFYDLRVSRLNQVIKPGSTIKVVYLQFANGVKTLDINQDLTILETTTQIDSNGLRTTALKVATIDRWPESDVGMIVSRMEQGEVMEAHPQISPCLYEVGPYTRRMDSSTDAQFIVRIKDETVGLYRATLSFRTSSLVSNTATIESASSSVGTSGSGGSATPTSAGGASHSHDSITINRVLTSSLTSNDKSVYFHQNDNELKFASDDSGPSAYTETSSGEATHTHTVNVPAHDHSVTIPAHSHNASYGLFKDSNFPQNISISINGTDWTSALGGPWAATNVAIDEEVDITDYLTPLRQNHTIEFSCTAGQGEIEAGANMAITVQAIVYS